MNAFKLLEQASLFFGWNAHGALGYSEGFGSGEAA